MAPWAVLRGAEKRAHDAGLGLYAWRDCAWGEENGVYTGTSLGTYKEDDEGAIAAAINGLGAGKADKVLELKRKGRKVELIDGETAGAPYLPRANDTYRLVGPNGNPCKPK